MRRLILGLCLVACTFAVSSAFALATPIAVGLGLVALAIAAPEPLTWIQRNPRSIFETRRLGLA